MCKDQGQGVPVNFIGDLEKALDTVAQQRMKAIIKMKHFCRCFSITATQQVQHIYILAGIVSGIDEDIEYSKNNQVEKTCYHYGVYSCVHVPLIRAFNAIVPLNLSATVVLFQNTCLR